MTPEEHERTSVFREQLEAARRASPPAVPSEEERRADTAAAGASKAAQPRAASAPRKQRSSSLPPAERAPLAEHAHHFFDDSIDFWRSTDTGALNQAPSLQAARSAATEAAGAATKVPKTAAETLADEVEAEARREPSLHPPPSVWRDETGALHSARPHA